MAPDVAAIQRLEEHALAVDPKAIESEFDRIWRETAGPGNDESTIRVRVLNFVAVAESDDAEARFEALMQMLPQRHPCRGLLAIAGAQHDRLGAVISAHCWRAGHTKAHVCSEEVLLTGSGAQQRELASAVLPLLVPDLPVMLWLMDEAAGDGMLASRLYDAADAVIFDSAAYAEPQRGFALASVLREEHGLVRHDLAWGRLSAWRALIAQLFDGADGMREIEQIISIELHGGVQSSEALLLASWLATRLGLALADVRRRDGRLDASFYDGTHEVRMSVMSSETSHGIDLLRIRTRDAEFTVERHPQSGHMHVRENWDSGSTRRIVEAAASDEASVIERALDGGTSAGSVYDDALRMAIALGE